MSRIRWASAAAAPAIASVMVVGLVGSSAGAGGAALSPTSTASAELPESAMSPLSPAATGQYQFLQDDTGLLSVEVPVAWPEVDTRPWINNDQTRRPAITATTAVNFEDFETGFANAGMDYSAFTPDATAAAVFADFNFTGDCTDGGQSPFSNAMFTGTLQAWNFCGGTSARTFILVANPAGMEFTAVVVVKTVTPEDEAHFAHILSTLSANPAIGLPVGTVPPNDPTTVPAPTVAVPTVPVPTAAVPTVAVPTVAVPTIPVPTAAVPTVAVPTVPVPTAALPTAAVPTLAPVPPTVAVVTVPGGAVMPGFQVVMDDASRLSVQVPTTWTGSIGSPLTLDDGTTTEALTVAPDISAFQDTYATGLFMMEEVFIADPMAALGSFQSDTLGVECAVTGTAQPIANPTMTGAYKVWSDCGGTTNDAIIMVANPTDGRQTTLFMRIHVTDAEVATVLPVLLSTAMITPGV